MNHSAIRLSIHPPTHSFIHSSIHLPTHSIAHSFIHSSIDPINESSIHPPTYLLIQITHSSIHPPTHSFIHPSIHSPTDSFIYSPKDGAIVSRLAAIEDMAGMSILCSDKTGTLTLNKMVIQQETPIYIKGR